jgi:hypothetical protein
MRRRPTPGISKFLTLVLSDDRPDLPALELGEGAHGVAWLPMSNGWHVSILTATKPVQPHERRVFTQTRDDVRQGVSELPRPGIDSGAILWVTTSPDGPPLFVQIVLGSDNFYVEPSQPQPSS